VYKVQIIAHLHPLKASERDIFLVDEGTAISDIIASRVKHGEPVVIVNANIVPLEKYDYKVKPGDHVIIKVIPQGEGFGNYVLGGLMVVAGIALAPFTGGASLWLSGMGAGLAGLTYWTAALNGIDFNLNDDTIYGVSAGQNQAAKWAGTPIILGKTKTTPRQLCAATRISGTDGEYQDILVQYLVGFGPLKISNIKLGNTLLSPNVSDVRSGLITDIEHFEGVDLEIRQGGDAPTLFPYVIHEENPGLTLYSGEEYVRETTPKCEKISVDITFSGLYKSLQSGKGSVEVKTEARYRAKGATTAWASAPLLGYFDSGSNSIKRAKSTVIRFNVAKTILSTDSQYSSTGEYEVMLKRITADSTDDAVVDLVRWTALRSVRPSQDIIATDELQYGVILGLAIRANDTISGAIGKLSCIAESLIPVWDGLGSGAAHWATSAISSNPAAMYLSLMRGASNPDPAPDAEIYWPAFEEWYAYCATKGWACDGVIDSFSKLEDILLAVGITGRASPTYRDAAYSVIIDNEKTTIVQFFGPHNSRNFTWKQDYPDRPHAFRAQFKNSDQDYDTDEREVYDDGYTEANAERFETISIPFVVDGDNVWKHGRYRMASSRLRPAIYSLEAPAIGIICEPGDLIGVTYDTSLWGIADAWVKSVSLDEVGDIVGITVNNALIMEAGKTYQIIVISQLGTQYTRTITTIPGENYTVAFSEVIPSEDPVQAGDHLFFGETGSVFARCIVVGMAPSDTEGNYTLYFVDEAPGVHTADSGTIPAWDSHITKPGIVSPGGTVDGLPVPIPSVPSAVQPQSPGILAHHSFDDGNVSGAVAVDNSGKGHHAAVADVSIIAGSRGKALQIDETGTFSCNMGDADLSTGWAFGKTLCIVSGVAGHEAYSNLLIVEVWNRDSTFKRWEVAGLLVDEWYAAVVNHNGTQAELWIDSVMVGSWIVGPENISQVLFKLTPHADITSLVHTAVDENIAYNRPLTSAEIDGYTAIGVEKKFVWADLLNEYAADGVINPQEKPGILAWFSEIDQDGAALGSYWQVRADAVAAGVSVVALDDAYNALYAYLYTTPGLLLLAKWPDPIDIDHSAWETVRANYYSAESAIPGAISIANLAAAAADATTKANAAKSYADGLASALQSQIDGNITSWFRSGVPTLVNLPASDWTTTALKDAHMGDLYYDTATGYAYRFMVSEGLYSWQKLSDSDIAAALAAASTAQETADGKSTLFATLALAQATAEIGDMFLDASLLYRATVAGASITIANSTRITPKRYADVANATALAALAGMIYGDTVYQLDTRQWYVYTTSWIADGAAQIVPADISTYAPKYLGSLTADPTSGMHSGDYYFRNNTTPKKIRRYTTAWDDVPTNDAQYGAYLAAAFNDLAATTLESGDDGFTFFGAIAANAAFFLALKVVSGFFDNITVTGKATLSELVLSGYTAGTNVVRRLDATVSGFQSSFYGKARELQFCASGTIRVSYDLSSSSSSTTVYGKIYINGVAVEGTEQPKLGTSPTTYTNDVSVADGDLVQLYVKGSAGITIYVSNFRLQVAQNSGLLKYLGSP